VEGIFSEERLCMHVLLFSDFLSSLLENRINRQTSLPLSEMATNYLLDETAYNFHPRRNF